MPVAPDVHLEYTSWKPSSMDVQTLTHAFREAGNEYSIVSPDSVMDYVHETDQSNSLACIILDGPGHARSEATRVPLSTTVRELVEAHVKEHLPLFSGDIGSLVIRHMGSNGVRRLNIDHTIGEAGLVDGDTISIQIAPDGNDAPGIAVVNVDPDGRTGSHLRVAIPR